MPKDTVKERVSGGWVGRNAKTGRFTVVKSKAGSSKASSVSEAEAKLISSKRGAALQRLADR
ncbi:MAG: hypothetical protein VX874_15365 [Pseudomonadota bacterium]|nr:hypothetical protein [Pseudomonadota bacterium]